MTDASAAPEGLELHMSTVLELYARARDHELTGADGVELVHDLRVAVRRCRSLAQGLAGVDVVERKLWTSLSQAGRPVFSGLGALRDAQVMREWVTALVAATDAAAVVAAIDDDIATRVVDSRAAVGDFDEGAWRSLMERAPQRAAQMLRRRPALIWLALTRLEEARQLHIEAMRRRSADALHDVRIGVKRLRYCLESLLPSLHAPVAKPLKKLQDILGEIHDLDVVVDRIHLLATNTGTDVGAATAPIQAARAERLIAYKAMATGRVNVWTALRRALPRDPVAVARCRRAYLLEVAEAAGADGRRARHCERTLRLLLKASEAVAEQAMFDAALLAHGRPRRRRRLLQGRLLGVSAVEAKVIRRLLKRNPLVEAARLASTLNATASPVVRREAVAV
jgi:CHAD domain-containing protein